MKVKLLTTISFFTYQLSISQTEKLLHGKVISNNAPLNKVEVINKTSQKSTITNTLGEFSILVNEKDSLLFFSKDYYFSRLKVTSQNIEVNNLLVTMILKPEELEEVKITRIKFKPVRTSQQNVDEIKFAKDAGSLEKYTGVYNGTIPNGVDFIRLGTGLLNLFKKEKEEPKKKIEEIGFKKLIKTSVPETFFSEDLKLNGEEKELFVQFCEADAKSTMLLEHPNILATMDFLYAKHEEFKKLQ